MHVIRLQCKLIVTEALTNKRLVKHENNMRAKIGKTIRIFNNE